MTWPAYPAYKDTKVEWLAKVPQAWEVGSFSKFGKFSGGSGFPHPYQGALNEEIVFHKVNALGRATRQGTLETCDDTISRETARKLGATIFSKGHLVFAKVGAALLLGRIASITSDACIDNNMMAFIPGSRLITPFARYLLAEVRFDYLVNPGAVPSVNEGQMRRLYTAVPPIQEQETIVRFLDREISKIDTLISKQEELIATLREDRTATISNAVTTGINPDVEMKDSGVRWLDPYRFTGK